MAQVNRINWQNDHPRSSAHDGAVVSCTTDGVEVVVRSLNVDPDTVRASASVLSAAEQQRAARFVFERDRRRFTVARGTLRNLLSERLDLQPEAVKFVYGPYGKPGLAPFSTARDLRFNVSHCEDIAVYAFAIGRELGVDIEAIREIDAADDIAARFFSSRENADYRNLQSCEKMLGFFNCWTRKEAFIKGLGDGLSFPLDCFDVSLAPDQAAKICRVGNTPGKDCGWILDSFTPIPGFVAALASEDARRNMKEVGI